MKKLIIILLLCFTQSYGAEKGFFATTLAGGGNNPIAAKLSADIFYKIPLSSDSGILWNSTCIELGSVGIITPADYNASGYINIIPIVFFNLKLAATIQKFYTTMGYGYRPLESSDSDYSSSALSDIEGKTKTAYKYSIEPTLKIKYNRIVLTNTFSLNYIKVSTTDKYYYEPYSDTAHKKNDWDYSNSLNILFSVNSFILAGVNNYYNKTISTDCSSNRIAGIILLNPELSNSGKITIGAMAGSYTKNKNYKGDLFCTGFVVYTIGPY